MAVGNLVTVVAWNTRWRRRHKRNASRYRRRLDKREIRDSLSLGRSEPFGVCDVSYWCKVSYHTHVAGSFEGVFEPSWYDLNEDPDPEPWEVEPAPESDEFEWEPSSYDFDY